MPFAKGTPRELRHSPDWQEKKKGVKKKIKMTVCHSPSQILCQCKKQLPEPIKNKL